MSDASPEPMSGERAAAGGSAGTVPDAPAAGRGTSPLFVALSCLRVALVSGTMALVAALLIFVLGFLVVLFAFRFIDPPGSMLMLMQRIEGRTITQKWVSLESISPHLIRAVIVSEDGQFCRHRGVDFKELAAAMEKVERGEEVRGASTISMQVAKNMFLWQDRSYLRKGLEIGMTLVMEQFWSKPRVLEIYLNIAEWGPGIFGAEAAARHHFGKPAARLTEREAALLAAALPSPIERAAGRPRPQHLRLAGVVERRMRTFRQSSVCLARGGV